MSGKTRHIFASGELVKSSSPFFVLYRLVSQRWITTNLHMAVPNLPPHMIVKEPDFITAKDFISGMMPVGVPAFLIR